MAKQNRKQRRSWGSLYQRGATWWIAYTAPTGRRVALPVGPSKPQAEELLRKSQLATIAGEHALVRGAGVADEKPAGPTVNEWADRWIAERRRIGKRSAESDEGRLKLHVRPRFGKRRLTELRPADVREWLLDLRAGHLAPRSVRLVFAAFRKMCNDAVDAELIPTNPCYPARRALPEDLPKDPIKGGNDSLTRQEVELLLSCAAIPERRSVEYAFAVMTGARKGEVRGLRWADVILDAEVPHVVIRRSYDLPTKTSLIRKVALHPQLVPILKAWQARGWTAWTGRAPTETDIVFSREDGTLADSFMQKAWRRDLAAAGCHRVRYHDLRVTLGTLLRDAGALKENIAAILGHRDRSTTAIYAKVTLGLQRTELSRLRFKIGHAKVVSLAEKRAAKLQISYIGGSAESARLPNLAESRAPGAGLEPATNGLTVADQDVTPSDADVRGRDIPGGCEPSDATPTLPREPEIGGSCSVQATSAAAEAANLLENVDALLRGGDVDGAISLVERALASLRTARRRG